MMSEDDFAAWYCAHRREVEEAWEAQRDARDAEAMSEFDAAWRV